MKTWRRVLPWLLGCALGAAEAAGVPPPVPLACGDVAAGSAPESPLEALHAEIESLAATDPLATVPLLCRGYARARVAGELAAARWALSLSMPLIAYLDRHGEAEPLLEFALPVFERELGPIAPEVAEVHVAWAWINFRRGHNTATEAAWQRALAILERNPGERGIELQKALVGLAQVRLALGDHAGCEAALDRALAILADNGETVSEAAAAIQNVYTNLYLRREDFATARRHAEQQLAIERQLDHSIAQTTTPMLLLGQILERLDEFEDSERILREAVSLAESDRGPPQRHYLTALVQLARLLNERGRPAEAVPVAERAIALGERTLGPDAPRLVAPLDILADARRATGELPEALAAYERADAIVGAAARNVERQYLVAHYRGLARLAIEIGDVTTAAARLQQGLDIAGDDATLYVERAQLLQVRARLRAHDDPASAHTDLERALELLGARLPPTHPRLLRVVNDLCGLELAGGESNGPHCSGAANGLQPPLQTDPSLRSDILRHLSLRAGLRGATDESYELAVLALAAAAGAGPETLWPAQSRLADVLHERGRGPLAVLMGKRALATIESLRRRLGASDERYLRTFVADKTDAYRTVADWLLGDGRIDEGLEVLGLLRIEEYHEFATRDGDVGARSISFTPAETRLGKRLAAALGDAAGQEEIARLGELETRGRLSVRERRQLETLLTGRDATEPVRAGRLRSFLATGSDPHARGDARARSLRAERLQHDLHTFGPHTALLVYLLHDDRLRILAATPSGVHEVQLEVDTAALRRDIGTLLDAISRRGDTLATAQRLHAALIEPVARLLESAGVTRLVIWPDGALRYVPFAALHDGQDYLVTHHTVQLYAEPTAGGAPRGGLSPDSEMRGFGVSRAVGGYPALPGVADELCTVLRGPISGLASLPPGCATPGIGTGPFAGAGFADAAFTATTLREVLTAPRAYSILHISTHFSLRPGNALRSYLVLGDGSQLTLDHIATLDLSGIALLTLSACQTGLGGAVTDDGREVEALAALAQRRGAARVLASLWRVDDASTGLLMQALYRRLAQPGGTVADALRAAQLALNADGAHAHPYYWAGFVVSGSRP